MKNDRYLTKQLDIRKLLVKLLNGQHIKYKMIILLLTHLNLYFKTLLHINTK